MYSSVPLPPRCVCRPVGCGGTLAAACDSSLARTVNCTASEENPTEKPWQKAKERTRRHLRSLGSRAHGVIERSKVLNDRAGGRAALPRVCVVVLTSLLLLQQHKQGPAGKRRKSGAQSQNVMHKCDA
jgi:hypothetical protein